MRSILPLFLFLTVTPVCLAQPREKIHLLNEAAKEVFSNPAETRKIAEYEIFHTTDPRTKATAMYFSALAEYSSGNLDLSLQKAFDAKNLAEEHHFDSLVSRNRFLIADLLRFLQLPSQAERFDPAQGSGTTERGDKLHPDFSQSAQLQNITPPGFVEHRQADLRLENLRETLSADSALSLLNRYEVRNETLKSNKFWQAKILLYKAGFYFDLQNYSASKAALEKALEKAEDLNNPFLLKSIHQAFAKYYLAQNDQQHFNLYSQQAFKYENIATGIENALANTAFQLISAENEAAYAEILENYQDWLKVGLAALLILGLLKIWFLYRYRQEMGTYTTFLGFLQNISRQQKSKIVEPEREEKYEPRDLQLLHESEQAILQDLERFEESQKFLRKDMSLAKLAALLHTNTRYLSEVINHRKGQNFNAYINTLRINYITDKIKTDPSYMKYKVSYLAEESGFSSHSAFTTVFKSIVGLSPSAFVAYLRDQELTAS